MAEYIERTEELILAMNAGARAIENTKRYHGAIYTKDVFSESPQEIPYLQAAKVLRGVSDAPAADVAPVVPCRNCKYSYTIGKRRFCAWGVCGGRRVPDTFFCAYWRYKTNTGGEKKEWLRSISTEEK